MSLGRNRAGADGQARSGRHGALLALSLAALLGSLVASYGTMASADPARGGGGPSCHGREATIVGTPGDDTGEDTIVGTSGRDVIVARGGDDSIASRGGVDIICGNGGKDGVSAGRGDDRVWGDTGDDILFGRRNDDKLRGGDGDDGMGGGPGEDLCSGGSGRDFARVSDCEHIRGATPIDV